MGVLSDDQFTALANATGASRSLHTNMQVTDRSQPGQYAVAHPNTPAHPNREQTVSAPTTRQQVIDHRDTLLADPTISSDPKSLQGAWPGKDAQGQDKVWLDGSRLVSPRRRAVEVGKQDKQIAIRDMGRAKDVHMSASTVPGNSRQTSLRKTVGSETLGYSDRRMVGKPAEDIRRVAGSRRR